MNDSIFRDLKPQNVLISQNMVVRIADFGLARLYQKDGQFLPEKYANKAQLGTDGYQSKFLMDKTNRATRRDDLIGFFQPPRH